MALSTIQKGKGRLLPTNTLERTDSGNSSSSVSSISSSSSPSSSDSGTDSSEDEDDEEEISQEYLDSLLEKARASMAAKAKHNAANHDEDVIGLDDPESKLKGLPPLDPGILPPPYITFGETLHDAPSAIRDLDAERAMKSSSSLSVPAPPVPPPELTKTGKPLTKKEKRAVYLLCYVPRSLKDKTTGPKWFDLPAPAEADLPRLHKEYEALRLRNQLDRSGSTGLPKHFAVRFSLDSPQISRSTPVWQIGTIIPTNTPFGGPSADNLPRSARKRTLVDELVDDAEARHYAKRKFNELQSSRAAKGRGTLAARKAARKPKW
ncbi:hypothetical protein B0F90DRAFT_1810181 [Multifurca ochricompacta]|uniref:Fcf2 pre-rRNA processing C-terminal domain-containing protein n=1 Tax=Multifurca ochricompacta TaxID=376703 RepID=A0AAD4M4M9_9AGAM|nr:hypothetical protein B0F90DRAFT_1810181 [Multifurca ochricompacta]